MEIKKINYLFDYFKYLKNPISCLLFKFGVKKNVLVKFKNAQSIELDDVNLINRLMGSIHDLNDFEGYGIYLKKMWTDEEIISIAHNILIYNPRLYPLNSIFLEYYTDYYSDFDIDYSNRTIIDIGCNAGDSSLFFASKGSKVYGFEPVKELYEMALKNIELNINLKDNIKIFNNGVSYKNGTISINSMNSVSSYISDSDSYDINVLDIADVLNQESISPDLLKMDCEGCEFEIIENSDLSMFNEIIFEYHSKMTGKNHVDLIKKLEDDGFIVNSFLVNDSNPKEIGFIHAYK